MTENEAIKQLESNYPRFCKKVDGRLKGGFKDYKSPFGKAITAAIQALKEIQQYRAIGTVEECRKAVERMKPRKPIYIEVESVRYTDLYKCPNCEGNFVGTGIANHCYHCGQAIDWQEE